MAFSSPSSSLPEQLFVIAMSNKIHSRLLKSENQQESHPSTFENWILYQDYSKSYTSVDAQTRGKLCTLLSFRSTTSPTLPRRDSQHLLLFTPFPSTRSRAICAFLLSSLSTTAQMVSAGDVLSPAGAAVCLCGWGCVYRLKIPIDPRWQGSSLPLPFHVSATYFWVARNWKNQSPITAGWECWEMGWPSCLLRGYWAVWKEVTLLTLASPLQGSAGTCMIHYGFL